MCLPRGITAQDQQVQVVELKAKKYAYGPSPVHVKAGTNVMMQPLAGGPPVQLTHLETEPALIAQYAWSKDGKKLAITRQKYNARDIMMFTGYR